MYPWVLFGVSHYNTNFIYTEKKYFSDVECLSFSGFAVVKGILGICFHKLGTGWFFLACDLCVCLNQKIEKLELPCQKVLSKRRGMMRTLMID